MSVQYKNEDISVKLLELDSKEKEILKIEDYGQRHAAISKDLSIEIMKLYAFYEPNPEQLEELKLRSQRYGNYKHEMTRELSEKARKESNNPLVFVEFPNLIYYIVQDQEAIKANYILTERSIKEMFKEHRLKRLANSS
jgi:hypothetical protein